MKIIPKKLPTKIRFLVSIAWITLIFSNPINGQTEKGFTSWYIGIVEDGSLLSFNLDHTFIQKGNWRWSGKIGVGINMEFPLCLDVCTHFTREYITLPLRGSALYSNNNKHYWEFGLASTILFSYDIFDEPDQDLNILPIVGFRKMIFKERWLLRIFSSWPVYRSNNDRSIYYPIGISLGKKFE